MTAACPRAAVGARRAPPMWATTLQHARAGAHPGSHGGWSETHLFFTLLQWGQAGCMARSRPACAACVPHVRQSARVPCVYAARSGVRAGAGGRVTDQNLHARMHSAKCKMQDEKLLCPWSAHGAQHRKSRVAIVGDGRITRHPPGSGIPGGRRCRTDQHAQVHTKVSGDGHPGVRRVAQRGP